MDNIPNKTFSLKILNERKTKTEKPCLSFGFQLLR